MSTLSSLTQTVSKHSETYNQGEKGYIRVHKTEQPNEANIQPSYLTSKG